MIKRILKKSLVISIMLLFIGIGIVPATASTIGIKQSTVATVETSAGLAPNNAVDNHNIPIVSLPFGDTMWGYIVNSSVFDEGICYFPLDDPGDIEYLHATESDDFLSGGTGVGGKWIACENSSGALWVIDPETGDMESIGGGGSGLNGLAYEYMSNILYGASGSDLYVIDPEDGSQKYVGDFGSGVNEMIGIAADWDGILYGWDLGDKLWTIDTDTGEATEVGPLGIDLNYAQDGGFDCEEDILYLTAYTISPNGSYLYACDKEVGECYLVGQFEGNSQITASVIYLGYPGPPHDVGVKDIISPKDGVAGENIEVVVQVKNYGNNSEGDVPVNVVILKDGVDEEYNETEYVDIGWGETVDVEMPAWTPNDWQSVSNEYIDYNITAYTALQGDTKPSNDYKEKWFELYFGYFHDVGCTNASRPLSGPAQTSPVNATIKNFGQYDECCFKTYIEIAEIDLDSQMELLNQDFSDPTFPPTGWTRTHSNWMYNDSSYAGGTSGEARFNWNPSSTDLFRLYTSAIDTSDYDAIEIEFKHYVDHWSGPYTLKVETSPDGVSWSTVWEKVNPGNTGPETVTFTTGDNVGSDTLYVAWTFEGNSYNINYWYIDDIVINEFSLSDPEYEDVMCIDYIDPGEEVFLEFDDWTPEFLAEETTDIKNYIVKIWTELEEPEDQNPGNDLYTKSVELDYFHDVGIKYITSPAIREQEEWSHRDNSKGPPWPYVYVALGDQDIECIVENIGTFPELDLTCYAEIYEYITNMTNGTLVYEDNITGIDLDVPLGGTEAISFDDYNFAIEGVYGLYLDLPLEIDDYPKNNKEELVIGADGTPPVSWHEIDPPEPDGDNGWYASDPEVTICASDPDIALGISGSGVRGISISIGGGSWQFFPGDCVSTIVNVDGDDLTIEYFATDNVGNKESPHHTFTIDMDQTPPDIEEVEWEAFRDPPIFGEWYVTFTCDAVDETSGMDRVEFYINEEHYETITGSGPIYEFTIEWSTAFSKAAFWFYHYDVAGNVIADDIVGDEITCYNKNSQSSQQSSSTPSSQSEMSVISSTGKIDVATSRTTFNDGTLSGYVNDTSMNLIGGAIVRVYLHGTYEENYTDSSGYYHVTNIPICYCMKNCTASQLGYRTEWVLLSIDENTTHDFILMDNQSPYAPEITGPTNVPPGTYEYTFKAIDPDEDDVKYFIEWGDDNTEETDFHASGGEVKLNHTFLEIQVYLIRAKAIDPYDYESDWGYMDVAIPKSNHIISPLFFRLLERFPHAFPILRQLLGF